MSLLFLLSLSLSPLTPSLALPSVHLCTISVSVSCVAVVICDPLTISNSPPAHRKPLTLPFLFFYQKAVHHAHIRNKVATSPLPVSSIATRVFA